MGYSKVEREIRSAQYSQQLLLVVLRAWQLSLRRNGHAHPRLPLRLSPRVIDFKDRPVEEHVALHSSEVLVKEAGQSGGSARFIYQIRADMPGGPQPGQSDAERRAAILRVIEPISGEVTLDALRHRLRLRRQESRRLQRRGRSLMRPAARDSRPSQQLRSNTGRSHWSPLPMSLAKSRRAAVVFVACNRRRRCYRLHQRRPPIAAVSAQGRPTVLSAVGRRQRAKFPSACRPTWVPRSSSPRPSRTARSPRPARFASFAAAVLRRWA